MSCAGTMASVATARQKLTQDMRWPRGQGKVEGDEHADGWIFGVASMRTHCGRRQIGRQDLVQNGGREQPIGHHGNQKNQSAELSSTALKDA